MSPENADCLSAAGIDCSVLANNHVLDWGQSGLLQTFATLKHLKIKVAGAGRNAFEAAAPATLDLANKGRVRVFSFGAVTSGIPRSWAATKDTPGVNLLTRLSEAAALRAAKYIVGVQQPGDLAIVSLHWGSNWGYEIPEEQQLFARTLIDRANVSVVHGHSSHHAKAIEVYHKRLILYGCGDFLNDYEGIRGLIVLQGRTLNGCGRCSNRNACGSTPASCSIQAAGSSFPRMPLHLMISAPTISLDPGQGAPLVSALA
jgi:poly-gamma-glutamate capsule biosynthesis protein CapA/YwtB (metallophosphatase superfamily)